MTRSRYRLDRDDVIRWVSVGWIAFAKQNASEDWDPESVIGRSVWSFIEGPEVRHLYELILRRVRTSGIGIEVPFRCDSPEVRRDLRLRVEPLDGGGVQLTVTRTAEPLPSGGRRASEGEAGPRPDLLPLCSWCDRVMVRGFGWVNVETAVELLDLFDDRPVPSLSHGACPDCYSEVMVGGPPPD